MNLQWQWSLRPMWIRICFGVSPLGFMAMALQQMWHGGNAMQFVGGGLILAGALLMCLFLRDAFRPSPVVCVEIRRGEVEWHLLPADRQGCIRISREDIRWMEASAWQIMFTTWRGETHTLNTTGLSRTARSALVEALTRMRKGVSTENSV